jgi:hypothetical protein
MNGQHNRMTKGAASNEETSDDNGGPAETDTSWALGMGFLFCLKFSINNYLPSGRLRVCQRQHSVSTGIYTRKPQMKN